MKTPMERLNEYKFEFKQTSVLVKSLRKKLKIKEEIYEKLCKQVSWATLIILNIAFVASVFLEVIFSLEMYIDIGSRGISEVISPKIVAGFLIVLVVILAAYSAHKLRLLWCKDLRLVEETLYLEKNYSQNEASIEVKKNSIKGAVSGFIIGGIVLSLVYFISLERISLLSVIDETTQFSMIEVLLPVILVLFEILTGTHVAITVRLIILKVRVRRLKIKLKEKERREHLLETVITSCEELVEKEKANQRNMSNNNDDQVSDNGVADILGLAST